MATRVFSEEELDWLRRFPEISREELIRFVTLTDADELFARSHRGPANVFGVAVQLCTLPWLGFVPDEVSTMPVLLGHISPAHTENVNFFGTITVDVDRELAKLASDGYRPPRTPATDRTPE
jgi:hypothetical protein